MLYPQQNAARFCVEQNGVWDFCLSHDPQGADIDPAAPLPGARPMAVPGSYNDQGEDTALRDHYGWAFYQKTVTLPALCAGQRVVLRFGAVTHKAKVWLDGRLIAAHTGGFLPFEADVTGLLAPGAAGADRVLTMDLHAAQIQGFFNIPVDHMLGSSVLIPYLAKKFGIGNPDVVMVAPDLGSVGRARKFTEKLDLPVAIIDKRRPQANVSEVMNIIGNVEGKTVILADDMIDTAGTLCNAAKALVEIGGAKEVYACATHGVLSGPAIQRLNDSVIKEVILLDTIPLPEHKKSDKFKVLSVAEIFTEAIKRIYDESSVSDLFN